MVSVRLTARAGENQIRQVEVRFSPEVESAGARLGIGHCHHVPPERQPSDGMLHRVVVPACLDTDICALFARQLADFRASIRGRRVECCFGPPGDRQLVPPLDWVHHEDSLGALHQCTLDREEPDCAHPEDGNVIAEPDLPIAGRGEREAERIETRCCLPGHPRGHLPHL